MFLIYTFKCYSVSSPLPHLTSYRDTNHMCIRPLDSTEVLFLILGGTSILFSIVVVFALLVAIYIPTNSAKEFLFLHALTNTC